MQLLCRSRARESFQHLADELNAVVELHHKGDRVSVQQPLLDELIQN